MFPDLGALLSAFGSMDPKQADALAAHMDAQGIPPPNGLLGRMKLGGPQEDTSPVPGVESPGTTQAPDVGLGSWMPQMTSGSMTPDAAQGVVDAANANPNGAQPAAKTNPYREALAQVGTKLANPTPMPGAPTGVTGGVKAPDRPQINPAIMQGIVQLLMHPHASQGLNLGSLIR